MQVDNVSGNVPGNVSTSRYLQGTEGNPSHESPYPSANSDGHGDRSLGVPSGSPGESDSLFAPLSTSTAIVPFKKTVSAAAVLRYDFPQMIQIWTCPPAVCEDPAAQHLLYCYVLNLDVIAKWRYGWDAPELENHIGRAAKGHQRAGPGEGTSEVYGENVEPPPYRPSRNREIMIQAAELMTFAYN
jgi:hypothetical protein